MSDQKTAKDTIRIDEEQDGTRGVLLHPSDDDLFMRTGKQVISACKLDISIEVWLAEFHDTVDAVRKWCEERTTSVTVCYCVPMTGKVVFFLAPSCSRFDFALADEMADLNRQLCADFNMGMVELHQVPEDELDRFLQVDNARRVYG